MDVTKIESQLLKSDKEHFNLNDIISNAVLDLQNQIEENVGADKPKNNVEAHGGRIWAQNNPDGKGAIFTFTLPLSIGKQ